MSLDEIRAYWPIIATVMNVLFILAGFVLHKTFATKSEVSDIRGKVGQLASKVESLPSKDDVHDLKVGIEAIRGEARETKAQLKGIERMMNLLLENELKEKP